MVYYLKKQKKLWGWGDLRISETICVLLQIWDADERPGTVVPPYPDTVILPYGAGRAGRFTGFYFVLVKK